MKMRHSSNHSNPNKRLGIAKGLRPKLLVVIGLAVGLLVCGCNAKERAGTPDAGTEAKETTSQSNSSSSEKASKNANNRNGDSRSRPSMKLELGGLVGTPLRESARGTESNNRFTRLDNQTVGLTFENSLRPKNMRKYLLNGAGLCTGDFDNDGLVDVFAVSQDGPNRLYRQTAPWRFEDVTEKAGGLDGGSLSGTGASFADVNNDGWLDLYVCNINGPNQLFVSQGNGKFLEEATARNADSSKATTMASFADYDNDGDLDIYLVNNRVYSMAEESPKIVLRKIGDRKVVHPDFLEQYFLIDGRIQEAGQRDQLLQNDGQGNFRDVTEQAGIAGFDMGLSATWWDYNEDGRPDLYVGNDLKSPDHLYRNDGNGKFTDVIAEATGHTPWFSMGADAADINNDGLLDLLIADMSSTTHYKQKTTMGEMGNSAWFLTMGKPRQFMRNTLLLNSGTDRFFEAANLTGLDSTDWSWSIKFADFDADGWVDVFVTNGVGRNMNDSDSSQRFKRLMDEGKKAEAEALLLEMPPLNEANLAFRNRGADTELKFDNVAKQWGVDHVGVSQGASVADIDGDGDLDLLVSNMNEPLGIYRNDIQQQNRVVVALRGRRSNSFGVGARVTIETGGMKQIREMKLASGFMSADHPVMHFGLGSADKIDRLNVKWPNGVEQQFEDIAGNQSITITEGTNGLVEPVEVEIPVRPHRGTWTEFRPINKAAEITHQHREFSFDDFSIQPLLPNKLSQLGPGVAWADVNDDGRDDFFVGAAAGQVGALYLQNEGGKFTPSTSNPWTKHRGYEDLGCLFFDIDADGDQDLYIASGGYERKEDSSYLTDRLYLNDGQGNFEFAEESQIPPLTDSSSCLAAADYDRDGDLDLFVGTRLLPAQWPLPATSRLLKNENGRLVEANAEAAEGLDNIGLVTAAVWSDVDGDGWIDLMLALEWDSIRYLKNEHGKLVDRTADAGLARYKGWWNSINAGDLDNDGDMDFVAMNVGLNTKYHASAEKPVVLFANDFDENGVLDLVEAEYEGDVCYPVRGKSCSSHAMPFLNDKFDTYHEFALADVSTIYSDDSLSKSNRFEANWLQSSVLINDGNGKFQVVPLPRMAQIAPGFGTVLQDFTKDGNLDLVIAQNFMQPQPETGQMDGGMGMMFYGNGDGSFTFVPAWISGISISGQGMALTTFDFDGLRESTASSRPDLLMSVNDGRLQAMRFRTSVLHLSKTARKRYKLRLKDSAGNRDGIGSRVVIKNASGAQTNLEVRAGEGYLSQSAPEVYIVDRQDDPIVELSIRWPDGSNQLVPAAAIREQVEAGDGNRVVIEKQM